MKIIVYKCSKSGAKNVKNRVVINYSKSGSKMIKIGGVKLTLKIDEK
jgi:hypothetical protein